MEGTRGGRADLLTGHGFHNFHAFVVHGLACCLDFLWEARRVRLSQERVPALHRVCGVPWQGLICTLAYVQHAACDYADFHSLSTSSMRIGCLLNL